MGTVGDFFEKVYLNAHHTIRVKSENSDSIICQFKEYNEVPSNILSKRIKSFATDWSNKIYVLWV